MDIQLAEKINEKLLKSLRTIDEAAGLIRENCSDKERRAHFEPISQAMALLFEALDAIYDEHPSLKPDDLQGD